MNKWWSKEEDDDEVVDPSPLGYIAVEAKYDWRPGLRLSRVGAPAPAPPGQRVSYDGKETFTDYC